jgi:hypothetical protein
VSGIGVGRGVAQQVTDRDHAAIVARVPARVAGTLRAPWSSATCISTS